MNAPRVKFNKQILKGLMDVMITDFMRSLEHFTVSNTNDFLNITHTENDSIHSSVLLGIYVVKLS